jgi:hypothetical protein
LTRVHCGEANAARIKVLVMFKLSLLLFGASIDETDTLPPHDDKNEADNDSN